MDRRGFTLIEILVVIVIIAILSGALIGSGLFGALRHRQVSEAARILQGALAGARDAAIRANASGGIRLLADASLSNTYNGFIPLAQPPAYTDGLVSIVSSPSRYPQTVLLGTAALVLEESPMTMAGAVAIPNAPTSWAWNVRAGDKLQINGSGAWYTVCGPITLSNPENFVNYGNPGAASPITRSGISSEYLLLTNGSDDNANGWIDEGWDGIDNNLVWESAQIPPVILTDESAEWEQEVWLGSLAVGASNLQYTIRRRPVPAPGARAITLPTNVVVDVTRSTLPTGTADLVCSPTGLWRPSLPYSTPASIQMQGNWLQFWLSERADVGQTAPQGTWWLLSLNGRTGRVNSVESPDLKTGLTAARQQ